MLTGSEVAASRGVDLRRLKVAVLATASLMVAALVAGGWSVLRKR